MKSSTIRRRLLTSLLLSCPLAAVGFGDADYDGNMSTEDKYVDYAGTPDKDRDGRLNTTEYVDFSYRLIDYGNDGRLDPREWQAYTDIFYEPIELDYQGKSFEEIDANGDGHIGAEEYADGYDRALFKAWDNNNSGYVEFEEYRELTAFYDHADEEDLYDFKVTRP